LHAGAWCGYRQFAAKFDSSTIEGKGLTMSLRILARAVSGSTPDEHKSHVRAALQKRKKELLAALAAVDAGLAQLSRPSAKKSAKRRAKKRWPARPSRGLLHGWATPIRAIPLAVAAEIPRERPRLDSVFRVGAWCGRQ
jgi:hypothetical protein